MKQIINIVIIGFANSGSSAVQDLLAEYKSVGRFRYEEPNFVTFELDHFRLRGMIADQLYPNIDLTKQFLLPEMLKGIRRPNTPIVTRIRPYISDKLYSLIRPEGFTKSFAVERIQQIKDQRKYYDLLEITSQRLLKENDYKKRISIAKEWLIGVDEIFAYQKSFIAHKPIYEESHLDVWPEVFEPFKVIVVIRDIKDQISSMFATSGVFMDLSWHYDLLFGRDKETRSRALSVFVQTTLMRMRKVSEMELLFGPDKLLMLDFEGLVNKYEIYKKKIESFLGLNPEDHIEKCKYFNPERSRQNINKYINLITPIEEDIIEPLYEWYNRQMEKLNKAK